MELPQSVRLLREVDGELTRAMRRVFHCVWGNPLRARILGVMLLATMSAHPAWAQDDAKPNVEQQKTDAKVEQRTEQKIALVIGNSAYRKVVQLPNPVNDAADMAASLTRLGFSVKHLNDLDYNAFRLALIEFGKAAKTADKAVFFFAGHGVEIDGRNWLIPVDAEIKSEVDVYAEAINLETLIDISLIPKVIGLVILDACRNDPFASATAAARRSLASAKPGAKNAAKTRDATRTDATKPGTPTTARPDPAPSASAIDDAGARGLAPVDVNDNVLVAFAAAAGTTANDGTGRNSPYSGSLVRHVETPGLEINYLFRMVHDDVVAETKTQQPAIYGTLSNDEVYLKGDAAVAAAAAEAEAERVAWTFVRSTNEIATLRRFQEQFPLSPYAREAGDRIEQLQSAEKFAWTLVEQQRSPAAYRAFLDIYPQGEHVEQARTVLASLGSSSSSRNAAIDLPKPPVSTYQLDSASPDATTKNADSIEKVWAVLRDSRDQKVVGRFAEKYPSMRHHRLPPGSDMALRRVDPTELMLRTAQDEDVNSCFGGDAAACGKAAAKYPDYVQLQFQRCRILESRIPENRERNRNRCMTDAVRDARRRGYLVSAYTRSAQEIERNRAYRKTVERVNQNVGNIVGNVVSNVVSNTVATSVSNAVSAASQAAATSAANAASQAAATAASQAASRAAAHAASTAASGAASRAASTAASSAASRAASSAAGRAASNAAGFAASRAASGAADRAAKKAAEAAAAAAANAASNIRVPSDRRLKQDIVLLGRTDGGLHLYRYRYIGDSTVYVGVLAQEVARRRPAAVSQAASGYLQVDYGRLGIAFLTYRDWMKRHSSRAAN
ncbi:caspase family protein [Bradyrhizobium prioriisuperbiae]|uniref:caspase family protein n=1 Tax=Bradyrhizobium prioriisuperbiae TaxID=2854389 RepID=UPI0028F10045|nr:caspase family protein [Bradyrhizobium prioritasuperba]